MTDGLFQIAGVINSALARIRGAGAVLVPFDSAAFDELAVSAWPGATADTITGLDAASNYESIEVLGRCGLRTQMMSHTKKILRCSHYTLFMCLTQTCL